jgi:P-type conjugative transfer protein TrbG
MSATRILWGQILVVFALTLAGIWTGTQWTASALGYQSELGAAWFVAFDRPIYPPYALFWWWFSYGAYAPRVFETGGMIAASGGLASVAVAIAMSVWRAREMRNSATYGSARWATHSEIARAGLLEGKGVVIGRHANLYLRHDGPEHVLCFAPTRSGKGVGLVVPTLLTWPHSAIVHDIKGENWELTAGFRARFSRVLLFDPTNEASAAYNPLMEVRRGTSEVRDVQNIADVLVDPVINTDRRTYHIELHANPGVYMASVSWTYPQDELIALRRAEEQAARAAPVADGLALERLNFDYRISGDKPSWRPVRVFDDGRRTLVEFPPDIARGEMPPFFVVGEEGDAQLVNYRVSGRYLIVDRLFARAELRLGAGRKQQRVRIVNRHRSRS